MLPFAFSIFTGAFLLFSVQPLIGKYILPWFGGAPGVWTTCLLFFQTLLLGGYAYAHFSTTRLSRRRQVIVHLVLLAVALAMLPIIPEAQWKPRGGDDPILRILLLLTFSLGLPYFVLSATGPLMQQWFSVTRPGVSPYRLYVLSNAGSLAALLAYPFYFEPVWSRQAQSSMWSVGLWAFAAGCGWCAWLVWRRAEAPAPVAGSTDEPEIEPSRSDRAFWFTLAAVASVMLLATTNKLSQDLAVIPFLWVLPLSLYLLSFILCFDHPRWYHRGFFSGLFICGALVDAHLLSEAHSAPLAQQVAGYATTLFAACMLCHGELFRLRPAPRRLTSFYLYIAAGGAAGGVLVGVIAPLVFDRYLELQLGLWILAYVLGVLSFRHRSRSLVFGTAVGAFAATFVLPALKVAASKSDTPWTAFGRELTAFYREHWMVVVLLAVTLLAAAADGRRLAREWRPRLGGFLMIVSFGLGVVLIVQLHHEGYSVVTTSRGFYGVLRVSEYNKDDPETRYFSLVHGATAHGMQFTEAVRASWATTYYGQTSGVGRAINELPPSPGRRLGLVGLGTGTLAIYGSEGDTVRIYEIDPNVERLARSRFLYLDIASAKIDVVLGDARLSMERELEAGQIQQFDLLALDAFSSDAIPVHLLTVEAFATYLKHLKWDGVIAVHTSNRYLDLRPVVENAARHFGLHSAVISDDESEDWWIYRTTWILVTRNQELLDRDNIRNVIEKAPASRKVPLWTDDHASLLEILR